MTNKFKAGDTVRILDGKKLTGNGNYSVTTGKEYKVVSFHEKTEREVEHIKVASNFNKLFTICDWEYRYVELVSQKPTKNQRIVALEKEVSELKLIVHELRDRSQLTTVINNVQEPSTIQSVEDKPKIQGITIEIDAPKSPNQQRAEIIKKAKEFVSNNLTGQYYPDPFHVVSFSNTRGFAASHNVRFIVNDKKGAVVALIVHEHFGTVQYRGIAKCMPTDVFNADIGKAIALGRALGLDVSEFENAVQPTEYAIGQIVQRHDEPIDTKYKYSVDKIGNGETLTKLFDGGKAFCNTEKPLNYESEFRKSLMVVNDTNAIYTDGEQS